MEAALSAGTESVKMDLFLTLLNCEKSKKSSAFQSLGLTGRGYRSSIHLDSDLEEQKKSG